MKHFLFLLGLVLSFNAAKAQKSDIRLGLGIDVLNPIGSTGEVYSMGYGAFVKGEYLLSENLAATLSGGYTTLQLSNLYKSIFTPWGVELKDIKVYPAKAGLKYNLSKVFHIAAEAGMAFSADQTVRGNSFAYAGGVGANFALSARSSFSADVRFEEWALTAKSRDSFGVLRLAYTVKLFK